MSVKVRGLAERPVGNPAHAFTVTPYSWCSCGPFFQGVAQPFGMAAGAYPTANTAILFPFVLPRPSTVYKAGWKNGTAAGNSDIGVYDSAGTRLVSSGSTANAGNNAIQIVDLTDTLLPGLALLYLAFAADGVQGYFRVNGSIVGAQAAGVLSKATSFALPSSLTGTARTTTGYTPHIFLELVAR